MILGSRSNECKLGTMPCILGHHKCFSVYSLCFYDLDTDGHIKFCRNAGHLEFCENLTCTNAYKCSESYCIPYRRICDHVKDCPYGDDEHNCEDYKCVNMLKCKTKE